MGISTMEERLARLRGYLEQALVPQRLDIVDHTEAHGHDPQANGAGHYLIRVVSSRFDGLSALKRHRLVYEAVAPMMPADVHALSIQAQTPAEAGTH